MSYKPLDFEKVFGIVAHVKRVLNKALELFAEEEGWEGRTGGYFCLADKTDGLPLLIVQVGEIPEVKAGKYLSFCQEKARRLAKNLSHASSWESRDPNQEKWGGAIRAEKMNGLILSFSGLPELGDEAVMLTAYCLAENMYWKVVFEETKIIAACSSNKYRLPLLKAFSPYR
ncbi:MAG: hypothetical protein Q8R12_01870 [bacterium]|nr:hypothetical protein [bacterium]